MAYVYGTWFGAESGDVYVSGSHQDGDNDAYGFVDRMDGATGFRVWRKSWGAGVNTLREVIASDDESVLVAVGSMVGTKDLGGLVGELSTTKPDTAEALVLGLDPSDGSAVWAVTIADFDHVDDGSSSSASHFDLKDGFAYVACSGGCGVVRHHCGESLELGVDAYSGAVVKLDASDGTIVWGADAPSAYGIAASSASNPQGAAVYVQAGSSAASFTLGDVTFTGMGSQDQYIVKIDGDGRGDWALQSGGDDLEYLRRIAIDPFGDVYTSGRTDSDPVYFDPLVVDTHITPEEPMEDMFVAKLRTTAEATPACLLAGGGVEAGSCYVGNRCYADGDAARGGAPCVGCDAAVSQTAFSGPTFGCLIDGACVDEGAYASATLSYHQGGGTVVSACAHCDSAEDPAGWSVDAGYAHDASAPIGEDCDDGSAGDSEPDEPPEAAPPSGECSHCGMCYTPPGGVNCVKEFESTCNYFYSAWSFCPVWKSTTVGGSPPNFRTLYLNQIEVDSADFWTDRLLSSSSRSTVKELSLIHI